MESHLTKYMGSGEWKQPPVERFYRKKNQTLCILFLYLLIFKTIFMALVALTKSFMIARIDQVLVIHIVTNLIINSLFAMATRLKLSILAIH